MTKIPVHAASNLTPAQIKAYRLMDNRSHQETDWDFDLLSTELLELRGLDLDLDLTGFDAREIDSLLVGAEDDERADLAPELPEHPVTLPGDLFQETKRVSFGLRDSSRTAYSGSVKYPG